MRWIFALCSFLSVATAVADGGPFTDRPLDFSLSLSQHKLSLDYGSNPIDTSVDRIGVAWRERFGERLQLGLAGGYSYLTQSNNPPLAGKELNGYHAGFLLDLELLAYARAGVSLHGSWLYQKVDHDDGMQQAVISWREPSARLQAHATLGGNVRVYGGARYGIIDGTQRLSGTLNETRAVTQTERFGGFVGVELLLEGNGYLGAATAGGPDRRTSIYFGRRF